MHALNRLGVTLALSTLACAAGGLAVAAETGPSAADCMVPAFKAGDADAIAACYAEDAVMWFPGGPLAQGRAAIREGFAGFLATVTVKDVVLSPMGQEVMGDTQMAWGRYMIRAVENATGTESVTTGRYTDVSKKIDGRWLYVVDHPSDDPPAAQD